MSKLAKAVVLLTSFSLAFFSIPVVNYTFAQFCDPSALVEQNASSVYKYGTRSAAVQNLQACLIEAGFDLPAGATGYYGAQTRKAVQEFYAEWYGNWHGNWVGPKGIAQLKQLFGVAPKEEGVGQQPPTPKQDLNAVLLQVLLLISQGKTSEATQLLANALGGGSVTPQQPKEVSVAYSSSNPGAGSLIAGAAQVPVLVFKVTNGTDSDVTVNGLTFKKVGVVSDINITNGYISEGDNILAQFSSFSAGTMTFSGNLFTVPAGQSKEIAFRVDVSSGAPSGNTVAFDLTNLSLSSGSVTGLPLKGSVFTLTTVSNPSLAQIQNFSYQGVTSQVDAGTNGVRIFAATLNVVNSPVKLMSLRLSVTGSINPATDLANLVLKVDGSQVSTVASVPADGKVYMGIANGALMGTGSHTLEVYADVLGTPNRNFKVEILRPYDVVALDTQYNTYISVSTPSGSATTINVRPGVVVMQLASDSPTGNIAKGQSNVTLLKFKMRSAGEAVRVKWLPFKLEKSGGSNWSSSNIDNFLRNVALYDDAGNQVGSTISQLSVSSACGGVSASINNDDLTCSFGGPSSNINYLLPANTERVFTLKVDVQTGYDANTLKASVVSPAGTVNWEGNNIEGQISYQTTQSQTVAGSSLTVASTPFTASRNTSVGTQTFVRGKTGAKLASFSLSASSAEGIEVSSLTFNVNDGGSGNNLKLQNMYVMVGNSQFGYSISTVDTNNQSYTFSGVNPFTIPAGGSVIVDVYADILQTSSTTTYTEPVDLTGASAVGAVSRASQTLSPSTVAGQNLTVSASGSFTAMSVDPSNPPARQIVLGSTGVELGRFRFTADNNEDIRINKMEVQVVAVDSTTSPATFRDLRLLDGSTVVGYGTALTLSSTNTSETGDSSVNDAVYTSSFNLTTPLVVPKNQTKTYTLAANVASYSDSPTSHNVQYQARVNTVEAFGADSQASVIVSAPVTSFANTQTTLRTKLTVSSFSAVGSTSGRVRGASDVVASLGLSVDPAYSAELRQLKLTFSGAAVSNYNASTTATDTANFLVELIDSSNNVVASTNSGTETGTNTGVFVFTLNVSPARVIGAGTSETLRIRVNSSGFGNQSNTSDALSIQIAAASDLAWREQGGSADLNLEQSVVPLTVTVSYE